MILNRQNAGIDLLVDGCLVVELETVDAVVGIHTAQVISYLKALDLRLGLLINFKTTLLKGGVHRVINF